MITRRSWIGFETDVICLFHRRCQILSDVQAQTHNIVLQAD